MARLFSLCSAARWNRAAKTSLLCAKTLKNAKRLVEERYRPNGVEVNPRGQGPRGYGSAARRLPAFEARDAGGVTPRKLR